MDLDKYKTRFAAHVKDLQNQITERMKQIDAGLNIIEDNWVRKDFNDNDGGGGITRAFTGTIFENAGVNTSLIHGCIDPKFAANLNGTGNNLWATGISLIIHPRNPRVPTVHANFRMIEQGGEYWFGGGIDLTPYYPYKEDFQYFHDTLKEACGPYDCYSSMKEECDRYFTNHHRDGEMRGIGGIFFDHHNTGDLEKDFNQAVNLSNYFTKSYFPIVDKRLNDKWDLDDEEFQLHRRGRYVEFNLIHDRGTLFGLKTKGRVDSILISLPARCKFTYCYRPEVGSKHEEMMKYYKPQPW